jgi:hypothetical protein
MGNQGREIESHVHPGIELSKQRTVEMHAKRQMQFVPVHAWPNSAGVTATGENAVAGLPGEAEALGQFAGNRSRRLTSLTSITSRMCFAAACAETPIGTSSVMTALQLPGRCPNPRFPRGSDHPDR